MAPETKTRRKPVLKADQIRVFRRDGWLCVWCGRPVIFAPVMKYLEQIVRQHGVSSPLAYYDVHWTRHNAPLLDHMGAVIDHVEAHSRGGTHGVDNFATACNKCNANKSNSLQDAFSKRSPRRTIRGKYGEPQDWDGLSTLFVVLIEGAPERGSDSEHAWPGGGWTRNG
jgi:5-methylcytosine-specific restriction endonuclease McrA